MSTSKHVLFIAQRRQHNREKVLIIVFNICKQFVVCLTHKLAGAGATELGGSTEKCF